LLRRSFQNAGQNGRQDHAPLSMDLGALYPPSHLSSSCRRSELAYFLVRNAKDLEDLRVCAARISMGTCQGTSEPVHLYLLRKGDFRNEGATAG
jgi:hypothetical protein